MGTKQSNSGRTAPAPVDAGVLGLGLMGHSIIACLLAAGHRVVAVTRSLKQHKDSRGRILALLRKMKREGLLRGEPARVIARLTLSENFADFASCGIVIESILENIETKQQAYRSIEEVVPRSTVIGSNTSSIPLTLLQEGARCPGRFVGIHWDEPAHVTRFMEIIAGKQTARKYVNRVLALAKGWGKEPSLVRRDARGFIANRISYAMFREACHLVESGIATMQDVDRSLRNDVGWWMPFAGPFRYMDLMGTDLYGRVMKDLLPELSTSPEVPELMKKIMAAGGRGIHNGRGFYRYTPEEAKRWERAFNRFNYEIRRLARKYPEEIAEPRGIAK